MMWVSFGKLQISLLKRRNARKYVFVFCKLILTRFWRFHLSATRGHSCLASEADNKKLRGKAASSYLRWQVKPPMLGSRRRNNPLKDTWAAWCRKELRDWKWLRKWQVAQRHSWNWPRLRIRDRTSKTETKWVEPCPSRYHLTFNTRGLKSYFEE